MSAIAPRGIAPETKESLKQRVLELEAQLRAAQEGEERLRKRLAEVSDFVDNAAEGLHRVGPDGTILWANQAELKLLGYEAHEYIGHNIVKFHADRPTIDEILAKLTKGETLYNHPARLRCKDGSIRDVLIHSSVLFEEDRFVHTRCFTRDVTEHRQAEKALHLSESRFRALMQQSPFSIQILSPDGRTLGVNSAWGSLWGVTLEQMADYNLLEDTQLEAKGVLPYLRRAFAGEVVRIPPVEYDPEATLPGRSANDNPSRWVTAIAYPLKDEAGEVREVVLIHNDITETRRAETDLRKSEETWRLLADTIPQLAWMAGADGYIFWYNRRWHEYTGTTPEQMEGWGWQSVHDPKVLDEVMRQWAASIATGEPFDMVFPLRGADGRFRPFLTRVNALRGPEGEIVNWFGTNTDISEIKSMEEALRDADRRKDEFLAMLAHELRNPLAPIRTSLQVLTMPGVDPAVAHKSREIIDRQVSHLVRLVDDLLDVSRVMQGKITLVEESVELRTVLAQAVEVAQSPAGARGQTLSLSLPDGPLVVQGDAVRLAQVFGNLLGNAVKFTEDKGHIGLAAVREGDQAVVRVTDDGIGIAPDMLAQVFELFVQADSTATRSRGGLGIGLTLAKNLVQLHGGTIEARSEGMGRGSELVVTLPLAARSARERRTDDGPPAALAGHRLMIVDDNADAADSLATLLRLEGHEVEVAYDGTTAVALAVSFKPALVFVDLGMPGMDGYEVARRLRSGAGAGRTVLVALSGWGQAEDRRRTAAAGFDHHLVKPAESGEIHKILGDLPPTAG